MEKLIQLIDEFEKRNDISIIFTLHSDGSMGIQEFWDKEFLYSSGKNLESIEKYLKETLIPKGKNHLSIKERKNNMIDDVFEYSKILQLKQNISGIIKSM